MRERVVVTGAGAITPLGLSVADFWAGLIAGRSGIRAIKRFDTGRLRSRVAGEVDGFEAGAGFGDARDARHADRYAQFAVAAAREAVGQAALCGGGVDVDRVAVVIGSSNGGIGSYALQANVLRDSGPRGLSPFGVPMLRSNMGAALVAREWGFRGPSLSVGSACATASQSIGEACRLIRCGDADVVIAGGSEAPICELVLGSFCAMRAVSTRNEDASSASRPFDRTRDGFVIAEGAGVLVLESEASAVRRGVRILGEIAGHGCTTDAHHLTQPLPDGSGASRAMSMALIQARCSAEDLSGVFAHGTGTRAGDAAEVRALETVFAGHRIPVTALKSMTGHLCGASGALDVIAAVCAIETGLLPASLNLSRPEPGDRLDHVMGSARSVSVEAVLCNAFGFGGVNSCLVVRRYDCETV
jgi:3-oxoacyl-[acyl-carrier-protein] synthase II